MQSSYPNGAYGINLTKRLAQNNPNILNAIEKRFEELDTGNPEDGNPGEICFREFSGEIFACFALQGILIPTIKDAGVFHIHQVYSEAEIAEGEEFEPGDLILGVGILAFPNNIKFKPGFISVAQWHLWTVYG